MYPCCPLLVYPYIPEPHNPVLNHFSPLYPSDTVFPLPLYHLTCMALVPLRPVVLCLWIDVLLYSCIHVPLYACNPVGSCAYEHICPCTHVVAYPISPVPCTPVSLYFSTPIVLYRRTHVLMYSYHPWPSGLVYPSILVPPVYPGTHEYRTCTILYCTTLSVNPIPPVTLCPRTPW